MLLPPTCTLLLVVTLLGNGLPSQSSHLGMCDYLRALGRPVPIDCSDPFEDRSDEDIDDVEDNPLDIEANDGLIEEEFLEIAPTTSTPTTITTRIGGGRGGKTRRPNRTTRRRTTTLPPSSTAKTTKKSAGKYPACPGPTYQRCRADAGCVTQTSCRLRSDEYCCLPQRDNVVAPRLLAECPKPAELNVSCTAQRPTTWCRSDADCAGTPMRMCCDTGCAYNVCIQSQGYATESDVAEVHSDAHCPRPDTMRIVCLKVVPHKDS